MWGRGLVTLVKILVNFLKFCIKIARAKLENFGKAIRDHASIIFDDCMKTQMFSWAYIRSSAFVASLYSSEIMGQKHNLA